MNRIYTKVMRIPAIASAMLVSLSGITSCSDKIDISGNMDSSALENSMAVYGYLKVPGNPRMCVTELRDTPVTVPVQASLTNRCGFIAGFRIEPTPDEDLVAAYNLSHSTDFEILPETNFSIEDDGVVAIAPGDQDSYTLDLTVSPDGLVPGQTYLLPVKLSGQDVQISGTDGIRYFLFKAMGETPSTAKPSGIVSIVYVEVNGYNPLNAGEWTMASSGKQLFDIVNIFAANIKFDESTGRPYLSFNPNIKAILDGREKYIRPLQEKGMKVCLTILPDHDGVGFANLTDEDIRVFAAELKSVVDTYGLDGVDFDDEYAEYTGYDRPGFEEPTSVPYAKLCYEVKKIMPDKLCTLYFIGSATQGFNDDIEGMEPGDFIDYSYYSSYGSWSMAYEVIKGMEKNQWGPYSWDMNDYGEEWMMTDQVRSGGYGVQVYYDLRPANDPNVPAGNYEHTLNIITRDLYDDEVTHSGINHQKDW